jgi:hypothetical protein
LGLTTGKVKSGATPDWDTEVVTEFERLLDPPEGAGVSTEYTAQTAITIMMGIAIFSALLSPRPFLATAPFPSLVLLLLDANEASPNNYDAPMANA